MHLHAVCGEILRVGFCPPPHQPGRLSEVAI